MAILPVIGSQLTLLCTKTPDLFSSRQNEDSLLNYVYMKIFLSRLPPGWGEGGRDTLFSSLCCLSGSFILAQQLSTNLADGVAIKETGAVLKDAAPDLKSTGMRVEMKCKEPKKKKESERERKGNLAPFPDR